MSMNRAQRRAAKKAAPKKKPIMHNLTKQERLERICQNGITPNDLKKEFDDGYHAGYLTASDDIIKACYAGLCIALNELYGFGEKRMKDVLRKVDNLMITRITGEDMIQEVMDRFGFKIDFEDAFDRIQEVDE